MIPFSCPHRVELALVLDWRSAQNKDKALHYIALSVVPVLSSCPSWPPGGYWGLLFLSTSPMSLFIVLLLSLPKITLWDGATYVLWDPWLVKYPTNVSYDFLCFESIFNSVWEHSLLSSFSFTFVSGFKERKILRICFFYWVWLNRMPFNFSKLGFEKKVLCCIWLE